MTAEDDDEGGSGGGGSGDLHDERGAADDLSIGDAATGILRSTWPWLLAGVALLAFVVFLVWGASRPDDPEIVTPSTPADGLDFAEIGRQIGESCLRLLVADTEAKRVTGLRYRESELGRVDGMIFVWDEPLVGLGFTMSGVVEPLDIGFYDPGGTKVGGHAMTPCSESLSECPGYPAPEGAQVSAAVETAPGRLPDGNLGGECEP